VVGVVVGVDDVPEARRPAGDELKNGLGLYGEGKSVYQNGTGGGHDDAGGHLDVQVTGEEVDVGGDPFL